MTRNSPRASTRSALTGKNTIFQEADVRIIDSRTAGGNLASMVIAALEWMEQGKEGDEIVSHLDEMIPRGRVYFLVATLEHPLPGGRIDGAADMIGTALQIQLILELQNEREEPFEKVRTHHRAFERIKELVTDQCPRAEKAQLFVRQVDEVHAEKLVGKFQSALGVRNKPIYPCGASITTQFGPGTMAVAFFA